MNCNHGPEYKKGMGSYFCLGCGNYTYIGGDHDHVLNESRNARQTEEAIDALIKRIEELEAQVRTLSSLTIFPPGIA